MRRQLIVSGSFCPADCSSMMPKLCTNNIDINIESYDIGVIY